MADALAHRDRYLGHLVSISLTRRRFVRFAPHGHELAHGDRRFAKTISPWRRAIILRRTIGNEKMQAGCVKPFTQRSFGQATMKPRDFLDTTVKIIIDRPLGSKHPELGFVYLLNYGYVPGVFAPDGEELDGYVLGVFEPLTEFEGTCIAVIHRTNDRDDKLVLAPKDKQYSDDQIRALTEFVERSFTSTIIR